MHRIVAVGGRKGNESSTSRCSVGSTPDTFEQLVPDVQKAGPRCVPDCSDGA